MRHAAAIRAFLMTGIVVAAGFVPALQPARAADAKSPAVAQDARGAKGPDAKKSPDANAWRYRWHGGQWWYWLPENRWVYWENNRWNDYAAPAVVQDRAPASAAGRRGSPGRDPEEVRPFYGHAQSDIYYEPSRQEEIGPFYGNALPREVFGSPTPPRFRRGPFYGRAGSSYLY
jgi:hypothetical protein